MSGYLSVYVVLPNGRHGTRTIVGGEDALGGLQRIVGGSIQTVPHFDTDKDDVMGYVNEEGLVQNMQRNILGQYLLQKLSSSGKEPVFGPLVLVSRKQTPNGFTRSLPPSRVAVFDKTFEGVSIQHEDSAEKEAERKPAFQRIVNGHILLRRHMRLTTSDDSGSSSSDSKKEYDELLTLDTKVCEGSAYARNGVSIELRETASGPVYEIMTSTIDEGYHRFSQYARVDPQGQLQSLGVFNAFGLGPRHYVDQMAVDELLDELADQIGDAPEEFWDVAVLQNKEEEKEEKEEKEKQPKKRSRDKK